MIENESNPLKILQDFHLHDIEGIRDDMLEFTVDCFADDSMREWDSNPFEGLEELENGAKVDGKTKFVTRLMTKKTEFDTQHKRDFLYELQQKLSELVRYTNSSGLRRIYNEIKAKNFDTFNAEELVSSLEDIKTIATSKCNYSIFAGGIRKIGASRHGNVHQLYTQLMELDFNNWASRKDFRSFLDHNTFLHKTAQAKYESDKTPAQPSKPEPTVPADKVIKPFKP